MFNNNDQLRGHRKYSHEKKYRERTCNICNKKLSTNQSLKMHLKTHLPSSERVKKFLCETCNKHFVTRQNLLRHLRVVHDKIKFKAFQCEKCVKKFATKQELEFHCDP